MRANTVQNGSNIEIYVKIPREKGAALPQIISDGSLINDSTLGSLFREKLKMPWGICFQRIVKSTLNTNPSAI